MMQPLILLATALPWLSPSSRSKACGISFGWQALSKQKATILTPSCFQRSFSTERKYISMRKKPTLSQFLNLRKFSIILLILIFPSASVRENFSTSQFPPFSFSPRCFLEGKNLATHSKSRPPSRRRTSTRMFRKGERLSSPQSRPRKVALREGLAFDLSSTHLR